MKIIQIIYSLKSKIFIYLYRKYFRGIGKNVYINSLLKLNGAKNISIGDNVCIEYKTWLAAIPLTGSSECTLEIGDECSIGHFNHIFATKKIVISKKVLTADNVYISDNLHSYENINLPIKEQPIKQLNSVYIGEGTWIGENVCIIGASIGKHCVIGANAVVTKDIPDYSIAVGVPAKVIRKYNHNKKQWDRI